MRNKRGTDHWWKTIKYKGDVAIYAKCKCGFEYNCSKSSYNEELGCYAGTYRVIDPNKMYLYCPFCGAKKKYYDDNIKKIDKFRWE